MQDGKAEGPWAHLLSQVHQNHNYVQNNHQLKKKKEQNLPENIFYNLVYKEGAIMRQVGITELWYSQISHQPPPPEVGDPKIE